MQVLIIGGTNFIGPHVVAALDRLGASITVYHRGVHEPELPSAVRHVHSSRATLPFLHFPSELSEPAPDTVLLMFPVGGDDARAAVARFTGTARRVVAISSGDVYRAYGRLLGSEPGPPEPVPLDENAALRESFFPYRATAAGPSDWTFHYDKILVEQAVLKSDTLLGTVLRLPAVYGPGDPYHRLRPYIKRMADRRAAILMGEVEARWHWSHGYVENVAQAIALAVVDNRAAGQTYNVGEERVPALAERVTLVGELSGWKGSIVSLPSERLPPHLRSPFVPGQNLVLDTQRLRTELGFTEPVPVKEGYRRTIAWELSRESEPGDPGPAEYAAEDAALR
ncbi:MAG TPA: NAD-dependent epimerase/dehydratase family protein [Gemmatimonadales bacterium]|nr:NAD-dependent epimerase/dehydratase family protein [Gemmatimonadales bacterium]